LSIIPTPRLGFDALSLVISSAKLLALLYAFQVFLRPLARLLHTSRFALILVPYFVLGALFLALALPEIVLLRVSAFIGALFVFPFLVRFASGFALAKFFYPFFRFFANYFFAAVEIESEFFASFFAHLSLSFLQFFNSQALFEGGEVGFVFFAFNILFSLPPTFTLILSPLLFSLAL